MTANLGHVTIRATLASVCTVLAAGGARAASSPDARGPTRVSARGVEFRRADPRTGKVTMVVSAARASAGGESAILEEVRLVRYSPGGVPVLEATAAGGRVLPGGSVALDGDVTVSWRGEKVAATFLSGPALWDAATGVLSSDGPVRGTLRGAGKARGKGEDAAAFGLDIEGTGLEVRPGSDRARILRDVSAVATGLALGPWRITADGGLELSGFAGSSPTLRFAGPVGLEGRGATARADGAEVALHESKDKDDKNKGKRALAVSRAWLVGMVHVRLDGGRDLPWGEGSVEVRAEAAEIMPGDANGSDARVVFIGTDSDPARVFGPHGVLRGTRIEIAPGSVRTDGGARSEFEWGGL